MSPGPTSASAHPTIAANSGGEDSANSEISTANSVQRDESRHYVQFDCGRLRRVAVPALRAIAFRTLPLYVALLRCRGIDLSEGSGNRAWLLPIPATFLVGQDGIVLRYWVNVDFTHRAEPAEILDALNSLLAPPKPLSAAARHRGPDPVCGRCFRGVSP